jgi:hypothetical protein
MELAEMARARTEAGHYFFFNRETTTAIVATRYFLHSRVVRAFDCRMFGRIVGWKPAGGDAQLVAIKHAGTDKHGVPDSQA